MAYYRGDYYMGAIRGRAAGDYYRGKGQGDPFWGALWTGIKAVGGSLLGVRPAGQTQAAAAAGGVSGVQAAGQAIGQLARNAISGVGTVNGVNNGSGAMGFMQTPKIDTKQTRTLMRMPPPMALMPAHGGFVGRRRRMNPANSKALRRSIRRVVGFARLASSSRKAVGKAATAIGCYRGSRRPTARRK